MSNELKKFKVELKLVGFTTVLMHGNSANEIETTLDCIDPSMHFQLSSSAFPVIESSVGYHEKHSIEEITW